MIIECCEKDYRAYDAINYSALKSFDNNRITYFLEEVVKTRPKDALGDSAKLGMLVDCMLLQPLKVDEIFYVPKHEKPTGQLGLFLDEMWAITQLNINEQGILQETMRDISELAWDRFKIKYPDKFKGKDLNYVLTSLNQDDGFGNKPIDYFEGLMQSIGKVAIDQKLYSKAERIVKAIINGKYTEKLFQPSRVQELKYQTAVIGELDGFPVKGLIDIIEINHAKKTVKGIDLKTTWQVENFSSAFKKMGYYLQASLYHYLLEQYIKDKGLEGYTIIDSFEFLVCDSTMQYLPHFEVCNKEMLHMGMEGFTDKYGNKYKGVRRLLKELDYCMKNNFYDNLELHENNGRITIDGIY